MVNTNYAISGHLSAKLGDRSRDPNFAVGSICRGSNGGDWIYVQFQGGVAQYESVHIDSSFNARQLTPALAITPGLIGFDQASASTSDYGWVPISGKVTIKVLGSCAKDVPLYTTDTAGSLDDLTASLSQHQLQGIAIVTTIGSTASTQVAMVQSGGVTVRRPAV